MMSNQLANPGNNRVSKRADLLKRYYAVFGVFSLVSLGFLRHGTSCRSKADMKNMHVDKVGADDTNNPTSYLRGTRATPAMLYFCITFTET